MHTHMSNTVKALTHNEKIVLMFYALAHREVDKTTTYQALNDSKILADTGKYFTQKIIKQSITTLLSLHLIYSKRYNHVISEKHIDTIFYLFFHTKEFQALLKIVQTKFPLNEYILHYYPEDDDVYMLLLRHLRIAIHSKNARMFEKYYQWGTESYKNFLEDTDLLSPLLSAGMPMNEFMKYPDNIHYILTNRHFNSHFPLLQSFTYFSDLFSHKNIARISFLDRDFIQTLFQMMIYRGKIDYVEKTNEQLPANPAQMATDAWIYFLRTGDLHGSSEKFEVAIKQNRLFMGKRTLYLTRLYGIHYILILIARDDQKSLTKATSYINQYLKGAGIFRGEAKMLEIVLAVKKGEIKAAEYAVDNLEFSVKDGVLTHSATLFFFYTLYWVMPNKLPLYQKEINNLHRHATKNGYHYVASEIELIWTSLTQKQNLTKEIAEAEKRMGMKSMLSFMKQKERWEQILSALTQYGSDKISQKSSKSRLIWLVNFENNYFSLEPKEQKSKVKGGWSKGKNVSLKRIAEQKVSSMTKQDIQISKSIHQEHQGYYYGYEWVINYNKALPALCSHPLLFLKKSPDTSVELLEDSLELFIEEKNNQFTLSFSEKFNNEHFIIKKESPTRYKLIKITRQHREIRGIIGDNIVAFPKEAKESISAVIASLSTSITVHSSTGAQADNIPVIDADVRIWAHILPFEKGLTCEMYVKPFGAEGPAFEPGEGGESVIAKIDGKRIQTSRNLSQELKQSKNITNKCSMLQIDKASNFTWQFPTPEQALTLLSELKAIKKSLVIAWPKGGAKRIVAKASMKNLAISVKRENDWFAMSGNVIVDKNKVYEMSALIELARNSSTRFIELGENDYLELTQELMQKLQFLSSWNNTKKRQLTLHPLNALAIEDITTGAGKIKSDTEWKKLKKNITEAFSQKFTPPSTFQAELRDYQFDGFIWLSRLSKIGAGACLADDMGLGKTIQALALMVQRGNKGAALVVAPASVGFNWAAEIKRFAPTLSAKIFGEGDRAKQIKALKPHDVLITTYGLMTNEIEILKDINWETVVFDEAQAIKNTQAKRTVSATKLQAGFKMITTGTPIENNLSELWSLFNLINPGLLGSLKEFNTKFAIPIEKESNREVKRQLKKIIQPLILRRRKSDVLDELPPKTEITLTVEMSEQEKAFYEALREEAVQKMEKLGSEVGHIAIFAEIMKLRRASCNPELILKTPEITSTKLAQFEKLISELKKNGHKVLIFSQFVDHLAILKRTLEKMNISYNYLDGSTPRKKRKAIVESFQAGESDAFLISLKAGGTGLNLTAANFVIHMDPWWNPAVEDQASDRAHRIGQTQPVTIYRLVAKNSIEEKILALHKTKRNLADGLLEGSDSAAKLTAKELIALMR